MAQAFTGRHQLVRASAQIVAFRSAKADSRLSLRESCLTKAGQRKDRHFRGAKGDYHERLAACRTTRLLSATGSASALNSRVFQHWRSQWHTSSTGC